ncbi:MAG: hypothetical protein DHS20C16_32260 [Phycisphaerae bacterium]|nr:MAG: hypothetical protein DHS20C16_32260 [Phycisphaerae bacterium]
MKGRIRKRRILKWVGVGLCVTLVAIWIAELYWTVAYVGGTWGFEFQQGLIGGWLPTTTSPREWVFLESWGSPRWWPQYVKSNSGSYIYIPIWMFLIPALLATLWLWRSDRRPKSGCVSCSYNLTGNVSSVCPECGAAIEAVNEGPEVGSSG